MPITLTTPYSEDLPVIESKQVKDIIITRVVIRMPENKFEIKYKKGYDDGQGGIVYTDREENLLFYDDAGEGITAYTDLLVRNPQLYTDLKNACYEELKNHLSLEGTVY